MNNNAILYSQTGRSMIEMLGVLAIIGVLSIGGIAGYSKAMTKYRINKTADQVSQLAQNIRTLYASQKAYNTLNATVIKKAHLAPEEMYETTGSTNLTSPFGSQVLIESAGKFSNSDKKAFTIWYFGLPQEVCIELLSQDWGGGASSGLIAIGKDSEPAYRAFYGCSGTSDYFCANDGVIPVDKAISLCSRSDGNHIQWKFY